MNKIRFGVITRVPSLDDKGNLALVFPVYIDDGDWEHPAVSFPMPQALSLRHRVFDLGEIVILSEDGREVAGGGRKPKKWDVTCEEFDTVEAAIARAEEVLAPTPGAAHRAESNV